MEFTIYNTNMEAVLIVDAVETLLWTDRFRGCGDFEIYGPVSADLVENCQQNYYVWNRDSEHMMVIESRTIDTGAETGSKILIEGRSLESLLDRRILWKQTTLKGELQSQLKTKVFDQHVTVSGKRQLTGFRFVNNPAVTELGIQIDMQRTGDTVYDIVNEVCETAGLGWKVVYNWTNKTFDFSLIVPVDRAYDNEDNNPYVVFSPDFENILSTDYYESNSEYKNLALIAGEGEVLGKDRVSTTYYPLKNEPTGLSRREAFIDARDIQSNLEDGSTMSWADYEKLLKERGKEKLLEDMKEKSNFAGEVEPTQTFVYGTDFKMGDFVQVKNEFGIESRAQITEVIFSQDDTGYHVVPTFEMEEEED